MYLLGRTKARRMGLTARTLATEAKDLLRVVTVTAAGTDSEESPEQVERLTAAHAHIAAASEALLAYAFDAPRAVERTEAG